MAVGGGALRAGSVPRKCGYCGCARNVEGSGREVAVGSSSLKRCCMEDEGWPFRIAVRVVVLNHLKLLG